MKFTKVRDVKTPEIAHERDAGIDFFVPTLTPEFVDEICEKSKPGYISRAYNGEPEIVLLPRQRVLIPSGIHVKLEPNMALIAFNKSGIASKLGLDKRAEVVDENYQGEVHISLSNDSNENVKIKGGMKIIQFLRIPVYNHLIEEVPTLEKLYPEETGRGKGGFGSTGI